MSTDLSPEIWNRAAMADGGSAPRAGDTALSAALAFHSMVMSGGFDHAFGVLTTDQIAAASDGFRYLHLEFVSELIGRAPAVLNEEDDDQIGELTDRYNELVPQDQTLIARFESALQRSPEDFAPIS